MSIGEVQQSIIDILKSDPLIYPSPFVAVLKRWAAEGGPAVPGATPEVWDDISGKMKPHISVLDGGDAIQSGGEGFGGRNSAPVIVGMVRANDAGRAQLGSLNDRIRFHFGRSYLSISESDRRQVKLFNRLAEQEGSELGYNGMILSRWILDVVSIDHFMIP